jgi:hypothetical protein
VLKFGRPELARQYPRELETGGGCVVSVDASEYTKAIAAIAGSAAPFHDCSLHAFQ